MKITPTTLTLNQLFSSANEQFVIPAYQRRYSWQEKQLSELFDDLHSLSSDDTHLLGSVVCLTYSHTAGINPLELVDGQQRVTSLSLLLKVIQDRYTALGNDEITGEIKNFLVCKGIDRQPKNKLRLGDLDNTDYSYVLTQNKLNVVKNDRLLYAYKYFKEWVGDLSVVSLGELYFKLMHNVVVIRLDVGEAKDAYRLFETINNRGLKLDNTDVIKNFILGHASSIDEATLEAVKNDWKSLIVCLDRIDTDKFFRQYMTGVRTKKITDTYLIDEFKKFYFSEVKEAEQHSDYAFYSGHEIEDPEAIENELEDEASNREEQERDVEVKPKKIHITDFSESLKASSETYSNILNRTFAQPVTNRHLLNLQRIRSFPSYIFLLNLFQRADLDHKTTIEILKTIEIFMLRRHICEYRTGELDDIFAKLIPISSTEISEAVKTHLAKDLPSTDEFREKFVTADFRREVNRAKYVLEQCEYKLIGHKGEYIIQSGSDVHLEHIIPQTIDTKKSKKEFGDWEVYLELDSTSLPSHKNHVNRIGNYTLIAGDLNIVASNNPFAAKLEEYKKSNIQLTKNLCSEFQDKKFDFSAVEARSSEIADMAVEIWKF